MTYHENRSIVGPQEGDGKGGAPLPPILEVLAMDVRLGERVVRHEGHKVVLGFSSHRLGTAGAATL